MCFDGDDHHLDEIVCLSGWSVLLRSISKVNMCTQFLSFNWIPNWFLISLFLSLSLTCRPRRTEVSQKRSRNWAITQSTLAKAARSSYLASARVLRLQRVPRNWTRSRAGGSKSVSEQSQLKHKTLSVDKDTGQQRLGSNPCTTFTSFDPWSRRINKFNRPVWHWINAIIESARLQQLIQGHSRKIRTLSICKGHTLLLCFIPCKAQWGAALSFGLVRPCALYLCPTPHNNIISITDILLLCFWGVPIRLYSTVANMSLQGDADDGE